LRGGNPVLGKTVRCDDDIVVAWFQVYDVETAIGVRGRFRFDPVFYANDRIPGSGNRTPRGILDHSDQISEKSTALAQMERGEK
jgi:hypothetical protein